MTPTFLRPALLLALVLMAAACPADETTPPTPVADADAGVDAEGDADAAEPDADAGADAIADADADAVAADADAVAADGVAVADTDADVVSDAGADADVDAVADADAGADAIADTEADADAAADAASGPLSTPWGAIEGEACGSLSAALASPDPSFHVTTWTFDDASAFDTTPLEDKPLQRYNEPNAGGSSKCSEVMSMTWLLACEAADSIKLETQIVYDSAGSITDYSATVDGATIGVSVTRAYLGPFNMTYTEANATTLLTEKLTGVNESTANVSAADAWTKQILHIWTLQPTWVPILQSVWEGLDATLKSDTVVLVTVEAGSDYIVTDSCDD